MFSDEIDEKQDQQETTPTKEREKDPYQQRYEVAERFLVRLVDVLKDNPFETAAQETETLWQCFTPAEYLTHHGREYGGYSLTLLEAQAITSLIKGELANGLFMAMTLSLSDEYQMLQK